MPMQVLVVGNGFDLAHGLPTSYWDCINFLDIIRCCTNVDKNFTYSLFKKDKEEQFKKINNYLFPYIEKFHSFCQRNIRTNDPTVQLLESCVKENIWLEFFLSLRSEYQQRNHLWIDFEREIQVCIQMINKSIKEGAKENSAMVSIKPFSEISKTFDDMHSVLRIYCSAFLNKKMVNTSEVFQENIQNLIVDLYRQLQQFTTCIEIYLNLCNTVILNDKELPEIEVIKKKGKIDKVLSFNYTSTFLRYVDTEFDYKNDVSYIHGKIRDNIEDDNSPLVIGIDDYLGEVEADKDVDFAFFKKYYQRILKNTGYQYVDWAKEACLPKYCPVDEHGARVDAEYTIDTYLYIFGHSLDTTDRDVLRKLILQDNTKVTIYHHRESQLRQQLKNLILLIGKDKLNQLTRSSNRRIYFKEQIR